MGDQRTVGHGAGRAATALLLLVGLWVLPAAAEPPAGEAPARPADAAPVVVEIAPSGVSPSQVEVHVGDSVTWVNRSAEAHVIVVRNVAADAGDARPAPPPDCAGVDPRCLVPGGVERVAFDQPGSYRVWSAAVEPAERPSYTTTVVVSPPPASTSPTDPGAVPADPAPTGGSAPAMADSNADPAPSPGAADPGTEAAAPATEAPELTGTAPSPGAADPGAEAAAPATEAPGQPGTAPSPGDADGGPVPSTTPPASEPTPPTTVVCVPEPGSTATTIAAEGAPSEEAEQTSTSTSTSTAGRPVEVGGDSGPSTPATTTSTPPCTPDTDPPSPGEACTSDTPAPTTPTTATSTTATSTTATSTTATSTTATSTTATTAGNGVGGPHPTVPPVDAGSESPPCAPTTTTTTTLPPEPAQPPPPGPVPIEAPPGPGDPGPVAPLEPAPPLTPPTGGPSDPPPAATAAGGSRPSPRPAPPRYQGWTAGFPDHLRQLTDSVERTDPRTTDVLADAVAELTASGVDPDVAVRRVFGRFPVGGLARYGHDWWFPRYGPGWRLHQGTDVFADHGTPVRAPSAGVVTTSHGARGGLSVRVTEPDGSYWYLAHLSALAEGFRAGATVEVGDVVGYVGNSGNARTTPPHLHLEYHPGGGAAIDPKPLLDAFLDQAEAAWFDGPDGPGLDETDVADDPGPETEAKATAGGARSEDGLTDRPRTGRAGTDGRRADGDGGEARPVGLQGFGWAGPRTGAEGRDEPEVQLAAAPPLAAGASGDLAFVVVAGGLTLGALLGGDRRRLRTRDG